MLRNTWGRQQWIWGLGEYKGIKHLRAAELVLQVLMIPYSYFWFAVVSANTSVTPQQTHSEVLETRSELRESSLSWTGEYSHKHMGFRTASVCWSPRSGPVPTADAGKQKKKWTRATRAGKPNLYLQLAS